MKEIMIGIDRSQWNLYFRKIILRLSNRGKIIFYFLKNISLYMNALKHA